ncbi:MAG: squalene/phytoene synthase family protein [Deltaproteobacteria bacterium]|nr:squalene/phytoene synthase family protein [Deltaproteobacteria bacterium]
MLQSILVNLFANRRQPPYSKLSEITDPEQFLWRILPHAARTFSFSIIFLPRRMRKALAVAYLYCRMLDTYEDLLPGVPAKENALKRFIQRLAAGSQPEAAPALDPSLTNDPRERTHLLLVNRADLIDRIFMQLSDMHQKAICRLVQRMGKGMIWSSRVFADQNGVLQSPGQLSRYCWHVLGTPILFAEEMQRLDRGLDYRVDDARLRSCAIVGEVIQLANITRDMERDYERGIFYHPDLPGLHGLRREECIREVRSQLVLRALRLAVEFQPFVNAISTPPVSLARGAAILLVITTIAYYIRAAKNAGMPAFHHHERITRFGGTLTWLKCIFSRKATSDYLRSVDETVRTAFARCRPDPSRRFVYEDKEFDVVQVVDSAPPTLSTSAIES